MPRYELSDGKSNKFWEIELDGDSFTTTYGRIGTSGQKTLKEFADEKKAKAAYDKLIAEKTKKGYVLAGAGADQDEEDDVFAGLDDEEEDDFADEGDEEDEEDEGGSGGARRFEFSEGKSNKFWEIEMDGSSVTTTYGRIGSDGKSTTKEFDDAKKAKKEYDKLIAEKTKKGYVET